MDKDEKVNLYFAHRCGEENPRPGTTFRIGMLFDSPLQVPFVFRERIHTSHPKDFGFLS